MPEWDKRGMMVRRGDMRWVYSDPAAALEMFREGRKAPASLLDAGRVAKCDALLRARDLEGSEWRRIGDDRYEAPVGRRTFFVEFAEGRDVVLSRGWVGQSETKVDRWMLEGAVA